MSAASALQKAVFGRLSADAALTALVGPDGITDRRLSQPAAPLLVIAGIDSIDHSTASEPGEQHTVLLEAWSEAAAPGLSCTSSSTSRRSNICSISVRPWRISR